MYSYNKNSYLQGSCKNFNPGLLNRVVQRAWDGITNIDEHDLEPPFNRLTSEQPTIPVNNVDPTRRAESFGRWALPKLRRELHSKNLEVVVAALTSISDLVHDPEKCYEAINLKIVDRLVDLLAHEIPAIRQRTAFTLKVMAGVAMGKEAIVNNETLLKNLLDKVEDEYADVRIAVAACLEMVARYWMTADVLVEAGFIPVLLTNLNDHTEIVEMHLETLKWLLYCDGKKIALDEQGFETLVKLLDRTEDTILAKACQAIVRLCMIKEGRKLAKELNLLPDFNRLLHDERSEVHTAAAEAITFCTIKSCEKIAASKIKGLPSRLVHLSRNKLNPSGQIFAIKALTSLCEHPSVRTEVRVKHYKDVQSIQLREDRPEIQSYKSTLMTMLQWTPQSKEL